MYRDLIEKELIKEKGGLWVLYRWLIRRSIRVTRGRFWEKVKAGAYVCSMQKIRWNWLYKDLRQ